MNRDLKHPPPTAGRLPARGRLLRRRSPRLATLLLVLGRAEHRLYEVLKDDPGSSAELISLFVDDIVRLRCDEQDLRDRLGRRWRLGRYRALTRR